MAITGLASWLGLTVAPLSIISKNDFTDHKVVYAAATLGSLLVVVGWLSEKYSIKKHFSFTYIFLGGNLASIACLVGLITLPHQVIFFFAGLALAGFFIFRARREQSLIFLLMGVVYGYIILTYSIFSALGNDAAFILSSFYFMLSSVGVILFLLNFKKFLGIKK